MHCCQPKQHSLSQLHLSRSHCTQTASGGQWLYEWHSSPITHSHMEHPAHNWLPVLASSSRCWHSCGERMQDTTWGREKETWRRSRERGSGIQEGRMEKEQGKIHTHSESTYSLSTTGHHQHLCLVKGEYIPLWYWTLAGIETARSSFINSDTQTFTFIKDDNGSTTLAPTVSKRESNSVVPNSNLPFDDFLIAIPHMIEAMGQAQWPKDHILDNPCCSTGLFKDKLTLMVYQEEQHKQWHHVTSIPSQGYDLLEISATLLESTESFLLWERHWKDDEAYKAMVSTFSPYKIHLSNDSPLENLPFLKKKIFQSHALHHILPHIYSTLHHMHLSLPHALHCTI